MKATHVFLAVALTAGLCFVVIWLRPNASETPSSAANTAANSEPKPPSADSEEPPQISKAGPFPKAVVDETVHVFGVMEQGQEGKHSFTIRNEGEADLQMISRKQDSTCQCTLGSLKDKAIPPGASTTVELSWNIKTAAEQFDHSALVHTNDPKNTPITFRVKGFIGKKLIVQPSTEWSVTTDNYDAPVEVGGSVHSETAETFQITKIVPGSESITVDFRPFTEEELTKLNDEAAKKLFETTMRAEMHKHALSEDGSGEGQPSGLEKMEELKKKSEDEKRPSVKSGYMLTAKIGTQLPVGLYRESFVIYTDLNPTEPLTVYVSGQKSGPVQIFANTPDISWYHKLMRLNMRQFKASKGKSVALSMIVKDAPAELELLETKTDPKFMKVRTEKDTSLGGAGTQRYKLIVEIPAGLPPGARKKPNAGSVTLVTNIPNAKEIKFEVEYASQ